MNELPQIRRRRRRGRYPFREVTCKCEAYSYPHRFGGGKCNGSALVEYFWNNGVCGDCRLRDEEENGRPFCQIIDGREASVECEMLQEFLRVNEAQSNRLPRK